MGPGESKQTPKPEKSIASNEDKVQIIIIQVAHLLSAFFRDTRYWEGVKGGKDTFSLFIDALDKLGRNPDHDGTLLFRYRGFPAGSETETKNDYVIIFGDIEMDSSMAAAVVNRLGLRMSHLAGRLAKAFGIFAEQRINSLFIKLPSKAKAEVERLKLSLEIASRFEQAVRTGSTIVLEKGGQLTTFPVIQNRAGHPDVNLTLTAGINGYSADKMADLIEKVHRLLYPDSADKGGDTAQLYDALFRIKGLPTKLIQPPLEINNVKWMAIGKGQKLVSQKPHEADHEASLATIAQIPLGMLTGQKAPNAAIVDPRKLAPQGEVAGPNQVVVDKSVVAFLQKHFGDQYDSKSRSIQMIYQDDYEQMNASLFGKRLQEATELLSSLEENPQGEEILDYLIDSLKERIGQVQDGVFDDIVIHEDSIQFRSDKETTIIDKVHSSLISIISMFKERSETRKIESAEPKEELVHQEVDFVDLARKIDIPAKEAEDIGNLLDRCFDKRGSFLRGEFESRIPDLLNHEKRIFLFLWRSLNEILHRNDRVAFLNSMQLLINQMKQPKKALRFLLADICSQTEEVAFSDRNAFMLANLLLRQYNKELHIDIEITPEEVMLVEQGLDRDLVKYMAWRIDVDRERILRKLMTIHKAIVEALQALGSEPQLPSVRFLLSLEREAYIFFSLIGCETSQQIILKAMKLYASPDAEIYHLAQSEKNLTILLQHLKIVIRAMGRIAKIEDLSILSAIKHAEDEFYLLGGEETKYDETVRRVTALADATMKKITSL